MESGAETGPQDLHYCLWITRIAALLIVALALLWVAGYSSNPAGFDPSRMDASELALFPFGMCLGYLMALRWPLLGGGLSLACLAVFVGGKQELIYVILFGPLSLPGVLFFFYGMYLRDQRRASF